jgi:hypothetical protein
MITVYFLIDTPYIGLACCILTRLVVVFQQPFLLLQIQVLFPQLMA